MASDPNRNLLFGILALQMDFITREQLVAATSAWLMNKAKPIGDILVEQGALRDADHQLLAPLVERHIENHDGDPEKSLGAVSSIGSIRDDLNRLGDGEIEATLSQVAIQQDVLDPDATRSFDVNLGQVDGDRFRILRPHAKGGLGEVFVAQDTELNRQVALKEIQSHYADSTESRERFLLEAEVTGSLEHPGIVPVYGLGQYSDGRPYYAMRFIKGDSLKEAADRYHKNANTAEQTEHTLELHKLLGRFVDVCNAIGYAHSRGVLHRDLKPGNIMLGKYGETLVVDWGLAKLKGRDSTSKVAGETTLVSSSGSASAPTQLGSAIGTPAFMPPEQAAGDIDQLGPASDVYSLGATLYYLLTGQPPVQGDDIGQLLRKVQNGDFAAPREANPSVPKPLEAVCLRAMATRPEDRYQAPGELAADIERWLADEPVSCLRESLLVRSQRWMKKHRTVVVAGTSAVALLIAGLVVVLALTDAANRRLAAEKEKTDAANQELRKANIAERNATAAARAAAAAERAERKLGQRRLYATHINLAQAAFDDARIARVLQLLDQHTSEPDGEDLRGFEWYYLDRACNGDVRSLGFAGATNVTFSPDGKRLSATSYRVAKVWDVASGELQFSLNGHTSRVNSVAFSANGELIATAGMDKTVRIWNANTGEPLRTLTQETSILGVSSVAFNPDGTKLACCGAPGFPIGKVKVWDTGTWKELASFEAPNELKVVGYLGVAFSHDGKQLAAADRGTFCIWDLATEAESLRGSVGHLGGRFSTGSVAFSPDGEFIATSSDDGQLLVWNTKTRMRLHTPKEHDAYVTCVVFSPDGKRLASSSRDRTIKIWDRTYEHDGKQNRTTFKLAKTIRGYSHEVSCIAFNPDGTLIASSSVDGQVKLWNVTEPTSAIYRYGFLNDVAFSPDGKQLAVAGRNHGVKIWNVATDEVVISLKSNVKEEEESGPCVMSYSADGTRLATATVATSLGFAGAPLRKIPGDVKVWDLETGECLVTLQGTDCVALSPGGRNVATGSEDSSVKIWDVETGREQRALKGHTGKVTELLFGPDGRRVFSASSWDNSIKIWDAATGDNLMTLSRNVSCIALSQDGKRLASGSHENTIEIWDTVSGQKLQTLRGHTAYVTGVDFGFDGRRLISASNDGTLKLWDLVTGQELLTLKKHVGAVECVAFSPNGQLIASGGEDDSVRLWDGSPSKKATDRRVERNRKK